MEPRKHTQDEIDALGKKGHAFKNEEGAYSCPIADTDDLDAALRAGVDDEAREYVVMRANALDATDKLPDTWSVDGEDEDKTARVRRRDKKPRHRSGPVVGPEVRLRTTDVEIRESATDPSGDTIEVVGTPVVYNVDYVVRDMLGEFTERMAPGVATGILDSCDCRFLFNHDGLPLARTLSGTLVLNDMADALQSVATLDLRQNLANDLAVAIERGDVNQMSVGFIVGDDNWNETWDDRTINRFKDMPDVSAVTYPASPTTTISIAHRMLMDVPVESRARIRKAWIATNELREGKVLSASNQRLLTNALEALHAADDADIPDIVTRLKDVDGALDLGQSAISTVLDKANPDGDAADLEPALVPAQMSDDAAHEPRTEPQTAQERRDASLSFEGIRRLVYAGLQEVHGDCCGDWCDMWICEIGDDWVVFEIWDCPLHECGSYKVDYTSDGETVSFAGDPIAVQSTTIWEPKPDSVLREDEQIDSETRDDDVATSESEERDADVDASRSRDRLVLEAEAMALLRKR